MKRFLKNIGWFAAPIILLAFPLDYWISNQLKKSNSIARGELCVWNDIYQGQINSTVLVYGSSRAWNHFDPEILESHFQSPVYNAGIDGYDFGMQYFRHHEILAHNPNPKTIVLSLDIFMFENRHEAYNSTQFLPYMFWDSGWEKHLGSYDGFRKIDFYIPLLRYAGRKDEFAEIGKLLLNPSQSEVRKKGFKSINEDWNNDLQTARAKFKNGMNAKIDLKITDQLEQFLLECQNQNIEVIMVFSPEYIDGQKFVKNREDVLDIFDQMAKKYGLTYLNYSHSEICTKKDYFYNSNHLNHKGVLEFNELFLQDLSKVQ